MKYLQLQDSNNNVKISQLALGCARFGTKVSEILSFEMMDNFFQKGGNCLDTARSYYEWVENGKGISERTIGKWLKYNNVRKDMIICTKGGMDRQGNNLVCDISKEAINTAIDMSLDTMGIDYLDIYLLHRDDTKYSVEYIIGYLNEIKNSGKARIIGVSNWTPNRIKQANDYARKNGLCGIQISQLWWSIAQPTKEMWNDETTTYVDSQAYQFYLESEIPVMAYTSQVKGFFSKAIELGIENVDDFLKKRILTDVNYKKYLEIKKICNQDNIDPSAIVLGYITSNKLKGIALIGVSNMQQLNSALDNADYVLEDKLIQLFDSIR